jgi:tRNA/tmRNA/rRNA uracil-C5-methylase (TrmA/RlmC/RlmD family)
MTGALEITAERPVAGGRMLGRHEGQVILIAGAIPGERVRAIVERVQRGVVFARTIEILAPSADRRDPGPDPACGGMAYAHIGPERQRALKTGIVRDAFARIARTDLGEELPIHASPDRGYRMRVRIHLRDGRLGSFREGTHEVCDVALTGQVSDACSAAIDGLAARLRAARVTRLEAVEIAENLDGSQRVAHLECAQGEWIDAHVLAEIGAPPGLTGFTVSKAWDARVKAIAGLPWVSDAVASFTGGPVESAEGAGLRRHARAFFQANRFLTPALVQAVLRRLPDGPVTDLYAGVGLFAVCAAASGWPEVTAVEGDPISAGDLAANAGPFGRLAIRHEAVEAALRRLPLRGQAVIVDPPRTGISRAAMDGIVASNAARIVYVSCDVPTLARDAARLVAAGYRMGTVEAFDLFPNTAHVEVLTDFTRATSATGPGTP